MLRAESAGDVRAVSSAGAMGLMQVMPDTWAGLRVRYQLGRDPYDPRDNILAGTAYLREMWDRYGDVAAMLAAYNAGPARYDEHRAKGRPLPAETRAYVASLAPVLRGERPSKIALVASQPLDWREAAVFVLRDGNAPSIDLTPPSHRSADRRLSVPTPAEALTVAKPGGLFVARQSGGPQEDRWRQAVARHERARGRRALLRSAHPRPRAREDRARLSEGEAAQGARWRRGERHRVDLGADGGES